MEVHRVKNQDYLEKQNEFIVKIKNHVNEIEQNI